MKALITGASSGIGRSIAIELANKGYDLVLVARTKSNLEETKNLCKTNSEIYEADLSNKDECIKLYNKYPDIDILVNNAGFGVFGTFGETNLDRELNMIDLNIKAYHILTKLYLKNTIKKDSGRILNVASSAGFLPGPLMATYYSTKNYVVRLTEAIFEELRRKNSNVKVSALCPGPVDTNFNNVAGVKFGVKSLSSDYVAKYTVNKMFKNKLLIIPGFSNRFILFFTKFMPIKMICKMTYEVQKRKEK